MTSKRKATNFPVGWQPNAEVTAVAAAVACGGQGSLHASLLGGGGPGCRSSSIVERNLLSLLKGDANLQVKRLTDDRPVPSLALSLRVGSDEEAQQQSLHLLPARSSVPPQTYAPTRHRSPSLLRAGSRSSVPPQTTYAPGSCPAGAGPAPQLGGNNSLQLPLGATPTPTPPEPRCGACGLSYDRLAADLVKCVSEDLDRRMGLLRQELSAEVRKEVLRLYAAAAAAGVPLPAAFSAGLPPPQPSGGAWLRCPGCGTRPGTVALKPYEHLCLCVQCSDASRVCLHCHGCSFTWTGAVETASRGRGRVLPS